MVQAARKDEETVVTSLPQNAAETQKPGANTKELLGNAVHKNSLVSKRGFLERLFTLAFRGFVYPQIWEDPEVDLEALKIEKDKSKILTIASGGCNIMNYLTESPAAVKAVDLNPAHVSLARLKLCAAKHLPDYESFFRFFGHADDKQNIYNYNVYIKPNLDPFSLKYWEGRRLNGEKRINYFRKNIYQFGLLGRFISAVHFFAKIYGQDPREILTARTMQEQEEIFDRTLGPIFDKKFVRFVCNMPPALYGLGIPPAQFDELKGSQDMADVLRHRLRRLACDFPIESNYFAWQAFGRGYDREKRLAVPRYLTEENYLKIKENAERVEVHQTNLTGFLSSQPQSSLDCYVFLDAQDWMNASQLNALWKEVARTSNIGGRVIFRTAGDESPLTEKLEPQLLAKFHYDPSLSELAVKKDRSSIYGGFHVYTFKGDTLNS
jgi:S-adenosylmethionine-diacylglycerol 3-amino-3-carboxypropyl transferase